MRRIAVLTSGGDAPGMNAAIRAVVRQIVAVGGEAFGVQQGFRGLLAGQIVPLGPRDVGGIMQLAGTVLGSSRSDDFRRPDGAARVPVPNFFLFTRLPKFNQAYYTHIWKQGSGPCAGALAGFPRPVEETLI
jgi:hypothetical protein